MEIELPANGWTPRPFQLPLWQYLENGGRRAYAVWHRRAGKDEVALHWAAVAAIQHIGNYWHMLPEASQARKAIWDAVDPRTGKRRIDQAFPVGLRANTREQDMLIRFKNGSTWQVVGSDNYDSLVGATPRGIVFSEWALANPTSWAMLRPILAENGGWAMFITTPRGRNHAAKFFEAYKDNPDWFVERRDAKSTGVFSANALQRELSEYCAEYGDEDGGAKFEQEYMCSFDAAVTGSYYGRLMAAAEDEGRVTDIPYNPAYPVVTAWDLGFGDSTVIWCVQVVGMYVHVIDVIAGSGVGLDWYAAELAKRPYAYAEHLVPFDAEQGEVGSGKRRIDQMHSLGLARTRVVKKLGIDDGINAGRLLVQRARFDRTKCVRGIEAMQLYRRAWDEVNRIYRDKPLHDWTSDYADAWRYLAVGLRDEYHKEARRMPAYAEAWDPYAR